MLSWKAEVPAGPLWRVGAFVLTLSLCFSVILDFSLLPSRFEIAEGQVSPKTVKSPHTFTFVSETKTQELKDETAARVPLVLRFDASVERQQLTKFQELDQRISSLRGSAQSSDEGWAQALRQLGDLGFVSPVVELVLGFDDHQWQAVISEISRLLSQSLKEELRTEQLSVAKDRLTGKVSQDFTPGQALVAVDITKGLLKPNMVMDEAETRKARQAAALLVKPVTETVMQGETIVRDGEVVRASHIEKLKAAGLLAPVWDWRSILGNGLLAFLLSLILGIYLFAFQPTLLLNDRRLALLWVVMVGTVLAARLTIPGRDLYPYLFPLATAPILIASLLDLGAAITSAAVLSVLVSYVAGLSQGAFRYLLGHPLDTLEMVSLYLVGSLVGVVVVGRAERLNRFFMAGAGVALVSFLTVTAFFLLKQVPEGKPIWLYAILCLVNGSLTAAIALGVFALLGHFFGVITGLQLLELAQPNQPLLRRLLIEAPGTYHHSIIIANMAERAAELTGADALLTRVGAYYHDVGKVLRPGFFVENQMNQENIHDRLEPHFSAKVVISHVPDGLKLAKQHRLPARIRDFIAEHHGTRLAQYFYQKALEKGEKVDAESFRYPGPRPQSRETALVMLADSSEATIRSAKSHSAEDIDRLVDQVVSQRLSERQLDECNLTLRDLQLAKEAFKGVLHGVFHPRIEYPPSVQEPETQMQTAPSADLPRLPRESH